MIFAIHGSVPLAGRPCGPLLVAGALTLAACGGAARDVPPREFELDGVDVRLNTGLAWTETPEIVARVQLVLDLSARHWGSSLDALAGWSAELRGVPYGSRMPCAAVTTAKFLGCTLFDSKTITALVWDDSIAVPEGSILPHEIGHAIIGDPGHADPRWTSYDFWEPLHQKLINENPYAADFAEYARWVSSINGGHYAGQWAP